MAYPSTPKSKPCAEHWMVVMPPSRNWQGQLARLGKWNFVFALASRPIRIVPDVTRQQVFAVIIRNEAILDEVEERVRASLE